MKFLANNKKFGTGSAMWHHPDGATYDPLDMPHGMMWHHTGQMMWQDMGSRLIVDQWDEATCPNKMVPRGTQLAAKWTSVNPRAYLISNK